MHANLYEAMIANATVVAGYRTYPHVDTYDTARRAGDILVAAIRGEVRPVMAWGNVPMLPHVMRQGTDDHPNRELQAALRRDGARRARWRRASSPASRMPTSPMPGCRRVVVTDGDRELAERLRDELLDRAWVEREAFVYKIEPLQESLARAKAMPAPSPGRGRSCCSTITTIAPRAARWTRPSVLGRDPARRASRMSPPSRSTIREAVQQAIAAGIGAEVTLSVGGKMAMPQIPGESPPLSDDRHGQDDLQRPLPQQGADGARRHDRHGAGVVIDTGKVEIALISRHVEPSDLNCLFSLGIDPMQKRYVMLKSRIHWRAGLGAMAKAVVECAGVGRLHLGLRRS